MMTFLQRKNGLPAQRRSAFSLVELLVVMVVASILIGTSGPAMVGMIKGNQMNGTLAEMAGVLEQARQYAVAHNTYVWVTFAENQRDGTNQVEVAVLASKSGSDSVDWNFTTPVVVPSGGVDLELIGKTRYFPGVTLEPAGTYTTSRIPDLPGTTSAVTDAANSPAVTDGGFFSLPVRGGRTVFNKAIQFTPTGEARKSSSPTNLVEFGLCPAQGTQGDVAVLRINGLTGQTVVYRP